SEKGRTSQNFSNPRNCVTWKRASSTRPFASSCSVILPCPSIRVIGSITIDLLTALCTWLRSKTRSGAQLRPPAVDQFHQDVLNDRRRGRTSRNENIHGNDFMNGPYPVKQLGYDLIRCTGIQAHILTIGAVTHCAHPNRIAHGGHIRGHGTVCYRHQNLRMLPDHADCAQVSSA